MASLAKQFFPIKVILEVSDGPRQICSPLFILLGRRRTAELTQKKVLYPRSPGSQQGKSCMIDIFRWQNQFVPLIIQHSCLNQQYQVH